MDDMFEKLEAIYHGAPINEYYRPNLKISSGQATITQPVEPNTFHAAGAVHGSVLFKLLDDAAFFAAQSQVTDVFVLTASMNIEFLRPVDTGILVATGKLEHVSNARLHASAQVVDENQKVIAFGSGTFMRGRSALSSIWSKQHA